MNSSPTQKKKKKKKKHAQQACEGAEQGITLDELQAALKLSARGKKPGSDGLPYEFYSQFCMGTAWARLIRTFATKHPLAPSGLTCRPRLLPLPASEQSVAETLQAMEVKWVASMQASSSHGLIAYGHVF